MKVEEIIKDIKDIMEKHDAPSVKINDFISGVEKRMEKEMSLVRVRIKELILKHLFFKNPNHYYIRLITIMKYLKKKGLDVTTKDIDLIVDQILRSIDGVKKVAEDRYAYKK